VTIPKGTALPASPVTPGGMTAIDCKIIYYSEAAGYLVGQIFCGTFRSEQQRELCKILTCVCGFTALDFDEDSGRRTAPIAQASLR
jgi:hypothetical protein